jgi:hypothetical protein
MNVHFSRWARRALTVLAAILTMISFLTSASNFRNAGWNNERTILYAAEGGLLSPREALMEGLVFGAATLIWFFVFAATAAPPNSRARWVLRGASAGTALVLGLSATAGAVCGDLAGSLFLGGLVAFPMAAVAIGCASARQRKLP